MFARTERLLLRPGWIEDAPALAQAIGDHAVLRNLAGAPWPHEVSDARAHLSRPEQASLPHRLVFSRTRGSPRLVGAVALARANNGEVELGYWIARPYWGLGFATEAARAMIAFADEALRLPRVVAGHFLDNPASAHVLAKLGFTPTGEAHARYSNARDSVAPCVRYARPAHAQQGDVETLMAA